MRPSNAPSNVALYKNLESVVIAPHLLGKIPAKNCVKIAFVIAEPSALRWLPLVQRAQRIFLLRRLPAACLSDVCVASRSHHQTIWERAKRKSESRRNHSKSWMLAGRVFGAGDVIGIPSTPEYWRMGGECGPLRRRAIAEKAMPSKLGQLGVIHEIYGRQALDRGGWPQNEREP
jgi:hypothetical protein